MSCFCGDDAPSGTGPDAGSSSAAVAPGTPDAGAADGGTSYGGVADAGASNARPPLQDAGSPIAGCCPSTVKIEGCRVLPVGGSVSLRAVIDGAGGGNFVWSTTSSQIRIENDKTQNPTIVSTGGPSSGRDAETVTVQRTSSGCAAISDSISLTVVQVKFSESSAETQGYDDMDTPGDSTDDHVSVRKLDATTVKVDIQGGLVGIDLQFVADDADVVSLGPVPASQSFDLTIKGGNKNKDDTRLVAKTKCPDGQLCGLINVNTYRQVEVTANVGRFEDPSSPGTKLVLPLDLGATETMLNSKYKAAVVQISLTDFSSAHLSTSVDYDIDKDGKLSYDIINIGGAELDKIKNVFNVEGQKIIIVHKLASYYYLDSDAPAGATQIDIKGGILTNIYLTPNMSVPLGTSSNVEPVTVSSVSSNVFSHTVNLAAGLRTAHKKGEPLEFPAAAWSGNPIVLQEGSAAIDILQWTIGHELGHSKFDFSDVTSTDNMMLHQQGATDHRLRYKEQPKNYTSTFRSLFHMSSGTDNQWDMISR